MSIYTVSSWRYSFILPTCNFGHQKQATSRNTINMPQTKYWSGGVHGMSGHDNYRQGTIMQHLMICSGLLSSHIWLPNQIVHPLPTQYSLLKKKTYIPKSNWQCVFVNPVASFKYNLLPSFLVEASDRTRQRPTLMIVRITIIMAKTAAIATGT